MTGSRKAQWRVYHSGCLELLPLMKADSVDAVITDPPYGLKFMGKSWDKAVPSVDIWRSVLRVLKSGTFAAIMCSPRQDCLARMIVNLQEAGFETGFTSLYWIYATGFPKAMNLSKAIDKRAGAERKVISENPNARKTQQDYSLDGAYAGFQPKPAVEPVIIAMKPLAEKSYLNQVLSNRKGCTWLDDGRIPIAEPRSAFEPAGRSGKVYGRGLDGGRQIQDTMNGRFPANVLVEGDVLNDGTVGKSPKTYVRKSSGFNLNCYGLGVGEEVGKLSKNHGDLGTFSRFFDLDAWWNELPEQVLRVFPTLIVPKASKREKGANNKHPTVKPFKLMSYLTTIFSRPDELVLDPFCGSGTTGMAAVALGRRFVGCDIDEQWVELSRKRIGDAA